MGDERLTAYERLRASTRTMWSATRMGVQKMIPLLRERPLGAQLSSRQRMEQGLIVVLTTIGGENFMSQDLAFGLDEAGLPDAIEIHDWTSSPMPLIGNILAHQSNRAAAARVAARVRLYQREYPGRPVHLVGYSGGGGEVVLMLEGLELERPVTAALLMGSTLSPQYNLATALRRTMHGIHNFYNPRDRVLLGLGMTVVGTMDRQYSKAAGMVGFEVPQGLDAADAEVYETKLHQWRWNRSMLQAGHPGGHVGWTDRQFVRTWLARIISNHRLGKPAIF